MLRSEPIQRRRPSAASTKGGGLWPPLCGFLCVGSEHWAYLIVETHDMCLVESQNIRLVETQDMCVSCGELGHVLCSEPTQRIPQRGAAFGRPPLWRRPKAASFVLALNTWHILLLRRKTCALLRAKTSALLRRKTCAVLRARTCALFRANTKETTKGSGRRPPPFVEAAEGRLL